MSQDQEELNFLCAQNCNLNESRAVPSFEYRKRCFGGLHGLGASIQYVCDLAGWSSPLTCVRFYSLDVNLTSVAQVLCSQLRSLD